MVEHHSSSTAILPVMRSQHGVIYRRFTLVGRLTEALALLELPTTRQIKHAPSTASVTQDKDFASGPKAQA